MRAKLVFWTVNKPRSDVKHSACALSRRRLFDAAYRERETKVTQASALQEERDTEGAVAQRSPKAWKMRALTLAAGAVVSGLVGTPAMGERLLGVDVSDWQGALTQTQWDSINDTSGKSFAFIRSSRGGTTGYYNESDSDNSDGRNTQSNRYGDLYFANNITRATTTGMLAGPYHFGRADITSYLDENGGTVTHVG